MEKYIKMKFVELKTHLDVHGGADGEVRLISSFYLE